MTSQMPGRNQIQKTMSCSLAEFYRSLTRLAPELEIMPGQTAFTLNTGAGVVDIAVQVLDDVMLGTLLKLPRCQVDLEFRDLSSGEISDFLARFDQAFQRGGG